MNKLNLKSMLLMVILGLFGQVNAQDFSALKQSIKFWTGSGNDSGAVVVTFPGNGYSDSSYVWGILFDDSISAGDAVQGIADADMNFDFETQGGFLEAISYIGNEGTNSVNNFWWNTFSLENGSWEFNAGLTDFIKSNDVFGMSYTDSDPDTYEPYRLPLLTSAPALNPEAISISDFDDNEWRWFGEGNSKALLFVDFDPANGGKSFVFGVKFDDSTTGLELLQAISNEDSMFQIDANSFLNSIIYNSDSGIGGEPNYWGTWSATNFGDWYSNMGVSEKIFDGDFFGCTYTDFNPALRPDYPQVVEAPEVQDGEHTAVSIENAISVKAYPNPFVNKITFESQEIISVNIFSIEGKQIANAQAFGKVEISSSTWQTGVYFAVVKSQKGSSVVKIIKE